MQLEALIDVPELFIGYDADNQWLYADWKGEYNQETARASCMVMLDTLRRWPSTKMLHDNSNVTLAAMKFTSWGEWWLSELEAAGLCFMAWVLPGSLLARQGAEVTLRAIESPRVGTFDDLASAFSWLQQQQPKAVVSMC
jgi:hypothetical protein